MVNRPPALGSGGSPLAPAQRMLEHIPQMLVTAGLILQAALAAVISWPPEAFPMPIIGQPYGPPLRAWVTTAINNLVSNAFWLFSADAVIALIIGVWLLLSHHHRDAGKRVLFGGAMAIAVAVALKWFVIPNLLTPGGLLS